MNELKCYQLARDFACPTSSHVTWALERDGPQYSREGAQWHPLEDLHYATGGNTWAAQGPLESESKEQLSKLWAIVRGGKKPYRNSHVLGDYIARVTEEVIVDEAFFQIMTALDDTAFDFTPHDKVWDPVRACPPWDGPFFFATLLPMFESYDLELSKIGPMDRVVEKYRGAYSSRGARRVVRASKIAGRLIWRDAFMRDVLCTQPVVDALNKLGVPEWQAIPVEVLDDRH
ncbi:hypothetical protein [Pontivivens ytuae]|uniref:Uncharacterized protein n=1 Tax=Pontivivens ytuae TaxID=2789856 RepID=A0A7S9QAP8_9RHOB|nr:hypothetical protein [Pontivivens ytuae]QPH52323.1 hypothetical protein I0K15_10845 [Pontivivens ytuae]